MPNQGLRYGNDSIFRRDDLAFKDFSFGYSYKTDWDFNKEDNYYLNKDYITLKLIDPINPKESRILPMQQTITNISFSEITEDIHII